MNREANRTQQLRRSRADHVLLFTATPINRGPGDLLALVSLLGADNFADSTLDTLSRLATRRSSDQVLSGAQLEQLRAEIARFTVRRTKTHLNELVERDPDSYRHPDSGRVCRYPAHDSRTYRTGETAADDEAATLIRQHAATLSGVARLERHIAVPPTLRADYTDERWLGFRLRSTQGLALHQVLAALRSSRAALFEHLQGTAAAVERYRLDPKIKPAPTGNVIARLDELAAAGPPEVDLTCPVPDWLTDPDRWAEECAAEQARYRAVAELVDRISPAREIAKAEVIADLAARRDRVLAFDQHPITLAALAGHLHDQGIEAVVATGSDQAGRQQVEKMFARTATGHAVALCSDALNEGLNLQGAPALVHLDLPTTLRVAEQRVGRVDRMDSPHDRSLDAAARQEFEALPQRMQRALSQMRAVLQSWISAAHQAGDEPGAHILRTLAHLAEPRGAETAVDPYLVAERWLTLVAPSLDEHRRRHHRRPYILLSDITNPPPRPLPINQGSGAFADLPELTPLAERVTACILGVHSPSPKTPTPPPISTWHASR